ncbi:hypothetical protein Hanom_Chr16g01449341 [Helianthus anomalus]
MVGRINMTQAQLEALVQAQVAAALAAAQAGRDTDKPSLGYSGRTSPNIFAYLPGRPRWKLIRYMT